MKSKKKSWIENLVGQVDLYSWALGIDTLFTLLVALAGALAVLCYFHVKSILWRYVNQQLRQK